MLPPQWLKDDVDDVLVNDFMTGLEVIFDWARTANIFDWARTANIFDWTRRKI